MTTNTEPQWLLAMPPMPLVAGVCVVASVCARDRSVVLRRTDEWEDGGWRCLMFSAISRETFVATDDEVRVDLATDNGLAYALRYLTQHCDDAGVEDAIEDWMWRAMRGNTTDADRLALARALAELV